MTSQIGATFFVSLRKQNLFHNVQASESPRLKPGCEIFLQQPLIQKRTLPLVQYVFANNIGEELFVFLVDEKVQLMAGKLGIQTLFFFLRFVQPVQHKTELAHFARVIAEALIQTKYIRKLIVLLELSRKNVFND